MVVNSQDVLLEPTTLKLRKTKETTKIQQHCNNSPSFLYPHERFLCQGTSHQSLLSIFDVSQKDMKGQQCFGWPIWLSNTAFIASTVSYVSMNADT